MAKKTKPLVGIIMGSDSDLPVMQGAADILQEMKVSFEIKIVSAHRTPEYMLEYAQAAEEQGLKVIIAGAGGAAHLPGMVASVTTLPVIGVPVMVGSMQGLDALLSIAQMPKGVPVATMAVDNSFNAGLFAVRILALTEARLGKELEKFKKQQKAKVAKANQRLARSKD